MDSIYGITTLQAYWYYHSYPNDSRVNKTSVAALWYVFAASLLPHFQCALSARRGFVYVARARTNSALSRAPTTDGGTQRQKYAVLIMFYFWIRLLDGFHLALVMHAVYRYLVTGFGDSERLFSITWCV